MRLTQLARRAGFAVGGALALALVTAPAALAQDTGTVYVVHGVPDTPVDVYVDGPRAIDTFEPGPTQGPVELQEVDPADRAPILKRFLAVAPGARPHIPVDRHAPLADFARVAPDHPVFRVVKKV